MASLLVEEEEGHEKCLKIIKIEIVIEQALACPFHMGSTGHQWYVSDRCDPGPFGSNSVLDEIDATLFFKSLK